MNRAQMVYALEEIMEAAKESKAKEMTPVLFLPKVEDLSDEEKGDDEYESLGFFISHNPLEKYRSKLLELISTQDLQNHKEGTHVIMGGLMTNFKEITTKTKKQMAFFNLEDLNGQVEVVAFSNLYKKNKSMFQKNKPIFISGKLEIQCREINNEEVVSSKIILMKIGELEEGEKLNKVELHPKEGDDFQKIYNLVVENPGSIPIEIIFKNVIIKTRYGVVSDKEFLNKLNRECRMEKIYGD